MRKLWLQGAVASLIVGGAVLRTAGAAAEDAALYCDTAAAAGGSGGADDPLNSLAAALAALTPNGTLYVRGEMTVAAAADALVVGVELEGATIRNWGDGRLTIEVAANYAQNSAGEPVLTVAATNLTLRGIDWRYGKNSLYYSSSQRNRLIDAQADGFAMENCTVRLTTSDKPPYNSTMAPIFCKNDAVFRNCTFDDVRGYRRDTHFFPLATGHRPRIEGCLFTNCWSMVTIFDESKGKLQGAALISNRFYHAVTPNGFTGYYSYPGGKFSGVFRSGYSGIGSGSVIAYNVFVSEGYGEPLFNCTRYDGFNQPVEVHHNTVVGFHSLVADGNSDLYGNHQVKLQFHDNILDLATVIYENSTVEGHQVTAFSTSSYFKNNAYAIKDGFATGAVAELESYDLNDYLVQSGGIALEAAPDFRSTALGDPDYYRLKQRKSGWVWQSLSGYPDYIGAIEPMLGSAGLMLLLR
ncbi:MAG: hypothetical protein ACI4RD_07225 [Kiritimatiellia bacterium]